MKLLVIATFLLSSQLVTSQPVNVMTYNLRFDNPNDNINQWSNRVSKVNALIAKYNPDLIGVQEALKHQIDDMLKGLPQYSYYGVGRDDGKEKGEYSAILFKKDRFDVLSQKTFWLSETPELPGSKSWDAAITRVVSVIKFYDKKTKKQFIHFNTHFDHIGKEARKNSALLIHNLIQQEASVNSLASIVSGDFNSEPTEDPYQLMTAKNKIMLYDTKPAASTTGTFCGFEVGAMPCKIIDYIFYTNEWRASKYQVVQDNDGKHYPSDHLPVVVELELK
ncbi:MAG: endonuclease/exonuclease/phosphatase family protein [Cytophagales bacterium]|jgi:endonuclease/exonuclease/phosphatase family metal-dependent hydrolase|nr:endonuclease/exonuclease/phosphatase family protein [Bacteroidota bacterium]MBS1980112.1 endonuclease/exonuclease/phosphatase family protein [Bacteroidota bacterium]WHZ08619.1 MAG: endonuclease/exonuclease/phosphatase family protein [Cytophagales bacterium]